MEDMVYVRMEKSLYECGKIYSKGDRDIWDRKTANKWKKNVDITILDTNAMPDKDMKKFVSPPPANAEAPIIKNVNPQTQEPKEEEALQIPKDWEQVGFFKLRNLAKDCGIEIGKTAKKKDVVAKVKQAIKEGKVKEV